MKPQKYGFNENRQHVRWTENRVYTYMMCYNQRTFESYQAKEYRYNYKYNPSTDRDENICDRNNITIAHDDPLYRSD
jgi:hypothetical protein